MPAAISVESVSKRYRIGELRASKTLFEALSGVSPRWRQPATQADDVLWALRDVSLHLEQGDVMGVIGRNGAGKSTLLKILSRVSEPTSGRIELCGRVGSLLEVGTGFHPELSGRENVFLNGAVLGMRRGEIRRKFDDIVEFAGIPRFMDTPVKRYSSGMYMRLAFSVAAHLEPEILIVDEVLAVGDAEFQARCLGKMGDVARHGRTVLFVSHNMTAVNQLCPRAVVLEGGRITYDGPTADAIDRYLDRGAGIGERRWETPDEAPGSANAKIHAVRTVAGGAPRESVDIDQPLEIEVDYWNFEEGARNLCVNVYVLDSMGRTVLSTATTPAANLDEEEWFGKPHPRGLYRSTCTIPANFLNDGRYIVSAFVVKLGPLVVEAEAPEALSFTVFDTGAMREAGVGHGWDGVVRVRLPWRTDLVDEEALV